MKECLEWYILLKIVFFSVVGCKSFTYFLKCYIKALLGWFNQMEVLNKYLIRNQHLLTFQFWKLHHCHSRVQMKRHCWFIYQNKLRDSRRSCEAHTREDGNRNKGCTKSSHSKWIELKEHLVIDTNVSCKVTSAHIWEGLDSNKWGEFRHWRNMQHKYKYKCR